MRKTKISILYGVVTLMASGCAINLDKKIDSEMSGAPTQLSNQRLDAQNANYSDGRVTHRGNQISRNNGQLVRFVNAPWIGGIQTVSRTEDKLPAVFYENYVLDFGESRVSLGTVAARLTKLTNIPVRVRDETVKNAPAAAPQTGGVIALPSPIPGTPLPSLAPGGMGKLPPMSFAGSPGAISSESEISVNAVNMKWNGRLRDFLDHLSSTLSLSWEYSDGAVVFMRLTTETYEVATFPGNQKFTTTTGGAASGSAGAGTSSMSSQSTTSVTQQGTMDMRDSILKTVQEMVSKVPGSSVTWADGSGRMIVSTSKEVQTKVRDFLRKENKMLRTMVNITFDLYSVKTKDSDEKGINWTNVFQSLNQKYGVSFSTPSLLTGSSSGVISGNLISGGGTSTTTALMALLNQYGETSQHRPVSITTLNGMWDTKSNLSTEGYLKETTPGTGSASGGSGAPGLKTDTVTTGDQFAVVPYVQNDNTVILKYSITLSDLLGMFDVTTGTGETMQKVQVPRTEALNASSTVALTPGETAVITGLSRVVAKRDSNRLGSGIPVLIGGSQKAQYQREHFLILVRATPM